MRLVVVSVVLALLPFPSRAEDAIKVAGTDVPVPKLIKQVKPTYPAEAQAQGIRGIVILDVLIDTSGKVASVDVIRSIPLLDEAAASAVRKWEYEVTKVDGKPVQVRLTQPITFALKVAEVTRQAGIPELRQGVSPSFPETQNRSAASVVLEVTLDPDGRVAQAELRSGEAPYSEALLRAIRTWRFAPGLSKETVSFRVKGDFIPGDPPRVTLELSGLRRTESVASDTPEGKPAPEPNPTSEIKPEATPPPSSATPQPSPKAAPPQALPTPEPKPTSEIKPAPAPSSPATQGGPAAAQPRPRPSPEATPKPPQAQPPAEVLTAPASPTPEKAVPAGVSAVRDVVLSKGVPDLVKGRRPVSPPMARLGGVSGSVDVRFSVDASGGTSVQSAEGPDLLKTAAEQVVASWSFRRTTIERLHLIAHFTYSGDTATAAVTPQE